MIDKASRAAVLRGAHAAGKSIADIAAAAGISVKRARQLLKLHGIATSDSRDRVQAKAEAKAQRKEASAMAHWGISATRLEHLRGGKLMVAFQSHRRSAACRGIPFEMKFGQWLAIWHESGKFSERGRCKGQYVMARKNDVGPYAVGNVEIKTCSENAREARASARTARSGVDANVHCIYPSGPKPWLAKRGKKLLGYFATEAEAIAARVAALGL